MPSRLISDTCLLREPRLQHPRNGEIDFHRFSSYKELEGDGAYEVPSLFGGLKCLENDGDPLISYSPSQA
jgi:hypothetical protein